jgi:hypothetical protein
LRPATVFFWLGVWVDYYRGASIAGGFRLRSQESSWNPGARSRIGSVPRWQGGKIRFWAEFGQRSEDRRGLEE